MGIVVPGLAIVIPNQDVADRTPTVVLVPDLHLLRVPEIIRVDRVPTRGTTIVTRGQRSRCHVINPFPNLSPDRDHVRPKSKMRVILGREVFSASNAYTFRLICRKKATNNEVNGDASN